MKLAHIGAFVSADNKSRSYTRKKKVPSYFLWRMHLVKPEFDSSLMMTGLWLPVIFRHLIGAATRTST